MSSKPSKYKWQRIGLIVFGSLAILIGIVFLGSFLHILFLPESKINEWSFGKWWKWVLLTSASIVFPIWVGIGSILARKWARALVIIYACISLVSESIRFLTTILEHDFFYWNWSFLSIEILFGPTIPLVFLIFYIQPTVGENCKTEDRISDLLDRFSLPILGVIALLIGEAFYMLSSLPINKFAVTFFNFNFDGWIGAAFQVVEISIIVFLVISIFSFYTYSWECVFTFQLFIALSTAVSTYPENGFNLAWNGWKQWLDVGAILIFIIWSRKYFKLSVFRNSR
jgi:hypothetical protein